MKRTLSGLSMTKMELVLDLIVTPCIGEMEVVRLVGQLEIIGSLSLKCTSSPSLHPKGAFELLSFLMLF